ncbi:helix-turn-helix domain-containing protein [Aquiflexum gelatinilyticum]|uniref:Helix-turn-helix domain-containing protein n=1 Tax=Aquiflexum gelatinilyticum TaxID=2961943 RepID=A0A9X2P2P2_9BACT|nr:helix-turn-helix domain-containing protein [Aquiflexum gelatinilyticum]MCR9014438.1 helix-turn-helix domain-containing protein [Aquiflexum gelatinilyticum]MCS4435715.1 helix-turn-helix domain-containing protein [Aquiflexum gelatinilyticum]
MNDVFKIESISQFHSLLQIPPPKHPLISVVDLSILNDQKQPPQSDGTKISSSFYSITLKHLKEGTLIYGRKQVDFQEGSLFFTYPDQVVTLKNAVFEDSRYSWGLIFHSDLILGTPLASKIATYTFFRYEVNEALHLSEDEKEGLSIIINSIRTELNRPIDKHTKNVFVSAIDLLLNHCSRYYDRQFVTRENENCTILRAIDKFLSNYFASSSLIEKGLPTALQCAEHVNLSPNYLSDLLRKETGKSTQEHIHYHLLEIAKDRLLGSNDSVKEIAHSLGFEYPNYFSNLFKKKMGVSPSVFRNLN